MSTGTEPRPIPIWINLVYTTFVIVLVAKYLPAYGALNFLYFCDVALGLTLVAMWTNSPRLASMGAVGIVLPQSLWMIDFLVRLTTGGHVVDLTEYMFDPKIELFVRFLSFFHFWLPIVLMILVLRWGYDRRAFREQCLLACLVLVASYLLTQDPTGPAGNVNKVFGPDDGDSPLDTKGPMMRFLLEHRYMWVGCLMLIHCGLIIGPSHLLLSRFIRSPSAPPKSNSFEGPAPAAPDQPE